MIHSIGQVMVYVDDLEAAVQFWKEQVGFEQVERQEKGGQISYRIAPKKDSEVALVLHDRLLVRSQQPEMNLGTPSLLLETRDLAATHAAFVEKGIVTQPIVELGDMKVFAFCDREGQYFAVREVV